MSEQKSDFVTNVMDLIGNCISSLAIGFYKNIKQCYLGYRNNTIPFQRLAVLAISFSIFWTLKFDVLIIKLVHQSFPHFEMRPPVGILRLLIWFLSVLSPFLLWGSASRKVEQAILLHLRDAFDSSGLKNNDKYPNLIREYLTESGTRKLQIFSDGIVRDQYIEKQTILENKLGVRIESIRQHPHFVKVIEIEIANGELPLLFNLDNVYDYKDFTFPIGKSRTDIVVGDLKTMPHYLFAGMTGKGKSTFIKTMITVLLANNRHLEVLFIDMKGSEAPDFDRHPKLKAATNLENALTLLKNVDQLMIDRTKIFAQASVSNIIDYNKKASLPDSEFSVISRVVLVIDEIAQLTPTLATHDHHQVKEASLLINKISRLGRSSGIHLVVGVQKPDTKNLDSTVKANLEGILCFSVANRAQSQVVLDNNKATDLDSIPGRAIWQAHGEDKVLQTPYLTKDQIKKHLEKETYGKQRPTEGDFSKVPGGARSEKTHSKVDSTGEQWNEFNN